jgi:alpha-tubulin suppressor-like RCC1 family protein
MVKSIGCRAIAAARLLLIAAVVSVGVAPGAAAEQASDPSSPAAGMLSTGAYDTCAVLPDGSLRCWGLGSSGELGYGNTANVGDVSNTPATVGPVKLGGHKVKAVAVGNYHTCAILDDGSVRCWGFPGDGRLGYGNVEPVLDPSSVGAVDLGTDSATGQPYTATAITAGSDNTCVILDTGGVECWGFGGDGENGGALGYNNEINIGGTPTTTPDKNGTVALGTEVATGKPYTATAVSTSGGHTCALLDNSSVECWGAGTDGQLGYGLPGTNYGESPTATVASAGPVSLGTSPGPTGAVAITTSTDAATTTGFSGDAGHTCAILTGGSVECWGDNDDGQLGYGNLTQVGASPNDLPSNAGPVNLGPGRTAKAISAGGSDTCAILDNGSVKCWGMGTYGRLGYPTLDSFGNQADILSPPASPVDLGAGRTAIALAAGGQHTCALLDNATIRCWGYGAYGQLGYCSEKNVGETNTPGSTGPVNLQPGDSGITCPSSGGGTTPGGGTTTTPGGTTTTPGGTTTTPVGTPPVKKKPDAGTAAAIRAQKLRAKEFRACTRTADRRPSAQRASALALCVQRYGRTPGRIGHITARALSRTQVMLSFTAPGTDGSHPPAATSYLIAQTARPIRTARALAAAPVLCSGRCKFAVTKVGTTLQLTITQLRPGTLYYYTVAARDNVTGTTGPPSAAISVRTR